MNLSSIKNLVTSKVGRQLLTAQKHSPALLFGAGVVGVIGTVVMASRATLKADQEVLIDHRKDMEKIRTIEHVDYTEEDRVKDTALRYTKTVMGLGKLYAPAIVIGVVSIGCLTGSHIVLTKRNAGLTAAYAALEKGFKEYRQRVVNDLGPDKDREYRYDAYEKEIVEDTPAGPKVTTMQKAGLAGSRSIYAKLWDERSSSWNSEPTYNTVFLNAQQQYATDRLRSRGHLFLNEVYDSLGLDRTKEGAVVGWVNGNGDNYVDFGIFNAEMQPEHLAFFTGRENAIWLDFNVDGVVYDKI